MLKVDQTADYSAGQLVEKKVDSLAVPMVELKVDQKAAAKVAQ